MSNASFKLAPVPRRESTLARVDLVLIVASLVVLAAAAAIHYAHIRTENSAALTSADLPERTSHSSGEALLRARIGFARMTGT